jgi:RNA polymerase sigma-70 factor (ECF subfamily)
MTDHAQRVLTELLVLRAQAANGDAMGLLVGLWHERLLRHATRLTGRDDAGQDATQEAWLEITRGLHRLDDPASFGPWAYKIVTRCSARWIRREQRRRHVEGQAVVEPTAPTAAQRVAEAADSVDAVRVALRRLPADQQAILELRYVEDYGIEQIAEVLGIAAGTVKSRLFQARQELRNHLTRVTQ